MAWRVFNDTPTVVTFVVFFLGALARGNATYWVGRGLRRGASRSRFGSRLDGPGLARASRLVLRFGAPVVSLSFLTVGVQSLVNAAAGALRMPMRQYLPAVTVGALLWAMLYTTIGMAVWRAWWDGVLTRWWPGLLAGVVIVAATLAARRRLSGLPVARTTDDPQRVTE